MSRYDADRLYDLLPAVYRKRDAQQGYPLRDLIAILAGQATIVEDDIWRLYDNLFIETCDDWVVPYIGDLIGARPVHPVLDTARSQVAHEIGNRRKKGTAAVLEQLARDVTGWPARVVEFFELLGWTQYLNHLRPHSLASPDLRDANALELLDGPFDGAAHTVDVRRIASRRGRHNIKNIGLYVWRILALPNLLAVPGLVDDVQAHYTFSPFENPIALFHHPLTETGPHHIAEELNVPAPIRPRALHADLEALSGSYYGAGRSIAIMVPDGDGWAALPADNMVACDLADWNRPLAPNTIAIDARRGRLRWEDPGARPEVFRVSYYSGLADLLGGGQYERGMEITGDRTAIVGDPDDPLVNAVILSIQGDPGDNTAIFDNLADALVDAQSDWNPGEARIIEILDSAVYTDALPAVSIPENGSLVIRSANEQRAVIRLPAAWSVSGAAGSAFELNGIWISGQSVSVGGELNRLAVGHCTFLPGRELDPTGDPVTPGAVSLVVESDTAEVFITASILGGIAAATAATVEISDTIIDAHDPTNAAYTAPAGEPFGGAVTMARTTVIGTIDTREMTLGENSLFLGMVTAERRQQGCVRYSWVLPASRVPRRYHCQPDVPEDADPDEVQRLTAKLAPRFVSLAYGEAAYCQLDWRGPTEILQGAEDESEMGVFSRLKHPQREAGLRLRLSEYLPVGLEAGILFVT
ncbi:MAG: hypothetical protein QNJ61_05370 [Desulfobacterales bacterium]|nr:hypothetical protein [Desulfobacterales bacterium]